MREGVITCSCKCVNHLHKGPYLDAVLKLQGYSQDDRGDGLVPLVPLLELFPQILVLSPPALHTHDVQRRCVRTGPSLFVVCDGKSAARTWA
jgi:hypothetical protein